VNFLVNLRISLVFDPFNFNKKGIKWPSFIESKHVIVLGNITSISTTSMVNFSDSKNGRNGG
jgi:hypothetical protein